MSAISSSIRRGLLNFPGADAAAKLATEQLLKKDYETHHCYFRTIGLHNHLSHHILAAYDLGASESLIRTIYDDEAKVQRPIDLKENGVVPEGAPSQGEIKEENWTKWLGDPKAYSAYVAFFSTQISRLGVAKTLENFIFSSSANGNGSDMLLRLVGGAFHPFIQVGYGLEFDSEIEVAAGMAQTAIHDSRAVQYLNPKDFVDAPPSVNETTGSAGRQPRTGPSILSILREIYDSPKLVPVLPYEPDALLSKRLKDMIGLDGGSRLIELKRIFSRFDPGRTDEELDARIEELIFASTLLTFGTGKKGRAPRLDFFLMHILTSSLFVQSFFKYIPSLENKRALFRTYMQPWGIYLLVRGRPRIDPVLLMSYTDHPVPPNTPKPNPHPSALAGEDAESSNPWPAMVADVLHAPESHTVKSLRTLLYGGTKYGMVPRGGVIGAFGADGKETHAGMAEVDGTVFVRAAGIFMDTLGWVTHGQAPGDWDRSALGWDDAWKTD